MRQGKEFVQSIAILKKRIIVSVTQVDLESRLASKIQLFVTCSHNIETYPGLPQSSKMESF